MIRICFVCLGNICRSPTAEGIFKKLAAGRSDLHIESAGLVNHHVGEGADPRTVATAKRRGVTLSGKAQQWQVNDFARFDYVIAMDDNNRRELLRMAPDDAARAKVYLLRSFDAAAAPDAPVPDPYYGDQSGFDLVFDVCDSACRGLLAHVARA